MKIAIIDSDLVGEEVVKRPPENWEYEGNPQSPQLSDGKTYTYHPVGIGGPQLLGNTDDHERQSESDENWVKTNSALALLDREKSKRVDEIKAEALTRIQAVIPELNTFDEIQFYREFWLSIAPAARNPTVNFQQVIDIYGAGRDAIGQVLGSMDFTYVATYSAINDPVWP